jgi:hypothetical protein
MPHAEPHGYRLAPLTSMVHRFCAPAAAGSVPGGRFFCAAQPRRGVQQSVIDPNDR